MAKQKYYVVWKGRKTGIFNTWSECKEQVDQFPDAKYKSYNTYLEAEYALANGIEHTVIDKPKVKPAVSHGIVVDAACNSVTGVMEYQAIDLSSGKRLFHQGPFEGATNNIGEFIAIVHALAYCEKNNLETVIYSDSLTAIKWVQNRQLNSKVTREASNKKVFELIDRSIEWLQHHQYSSRVEKWDTKSWGENPADFGRK